LIGWCPTVLYWPDVVGDHQSRRFSNAFYRSLAMGLSVTVAAASSSPASGATEPLVLADEKARIF